MRVLFLLLLYCFSLDACGLAFIRLKKPLDYYQEKYGDAKWGLFKLKILMDRERNRGQDGAGIAVVETGKNEIFIDRDLSLDALFERFPQIKAGTLLLGHLRYGTSGKHELKECHPLLHQAEDPNQTFAFAGNFNLTNANDILGTNNEQNDTFAILKTFVESYTCSPLTTLKKAASLWDGGYVLCQIYANGEAIICRDPSGIRPGYFFQNEEVFAVASERSTLIDTFETSEEEVHPIPSGYAIFFSKLGELEMARFLDSSLEKNCVFERIYFSKGNDSEIYQERKELGRQLASRVWDAIQGDLSHTVFTYVPHSSQPAFMGLIEKIEHLHRKKIENKILEKASLNEIQILLQQQIRNEMLIVKNQKMRTFISPDHMRGKWVSQIYEITPKVVTPADTLVVVDDSIVRGVTLKESLVQKLISLKPKKIIIVSSAPPVYFPDCYGIDISQIGRFIAFQAAVDLYKEKEGHLPTQLSEVYASSNLENIEHKVAQLITPIDETWKGEIEVIYQSLEGLHQAIPRAKGDWVFSGQYPTPGGFKVLQTSFDNWLKHNDSRCY